MKVFQGFNEKGKCLICQKNTDLPCTLIGIVGTEEGHNMQAEAVHIDCLELRYHPKEKLIVMPL